VSDLFTVFATVFLAELGDKTQLATVLFAAKPGVSAWGVFAAAALALIASTALAVAFGTAAARLLDTVPLKPVAGALFVLLGAWMVVDHLRGAA